MLKEFEDYLLRELTYRFSRSSGPGGQHSNKVSTKVVLYYDVKASLSLSEKQKQLLYVKLNNRLSNEGILQLSCEETRNQSKNKQILTRRFLELISNALQPETPRIKTKPTKASKERRIADKKMKSQKKEMRKLKRDM